MVQRIFATFIEASAYAKRLAEQCGVTIPIVRCGEDFAVEEINSVSYPAETVSSSLVTNNSTLRKTAIGGSISALLAEQRLMANKASVKKKKKMPNGMTSNPILSTSRFKPLVAKGAFSHLSSNPANRGSTEHIPSLNTNAGSAGVSVNKENYPKRYIDEGLSGSREAHYEMRKQDRNEMRKRSR